MEERGMISSRVYAPLSNKFHMNNAHIFMKFALLAMTVPVTASSAHIAIPFSILSNHICPYCKHVHFQHYPIIHIHLFA